MGANQAAGVSSAGLTNSAKSRQRWLRVLLGTQLARGRLAENRQLETTHIGGKSKDCPEITINIWNIGGAHRERKWLLENLEI